jgi:hypothetical protein
MKQAGIHERIHKSFRVWLYETGIRVQQTDFTDPAAGLHITLELQQLVKALDRKCLLETRFFFPALALQAPFSLPMLEEQHREAQVHAHGLARLLQQYAEPGTPGHYAKTGLAIQQVFCQLLSFLMVYMNQQDSLFRESGNGMDNDAVSLEAIADLLSGGQDRAGWMAFLLRGMVAQEISRWLENPSGAPLSEKWAMLQAGNPALYAQLADQARKQKLRVAA